MTVLKIFKSYAGLYRPDVPVIVFTGTIGGRVLTGNFSPLSILQALFLALFPYNFVYILNSITDKVEDSIDKPWRPIPSGEITEKSALTYLCIVTTVSVSGIPFLFSGVEIFLAYLVILLGFSYSMKPLSLKNRGVLASVVTGWGVVHPLYITGGMALAFLTTSLLFHAIGVTLLKGLSDSKGDSAAGRTVITDSVSLTALFLISLFLMFLSFVSFFFTSNSFISIIPGVSAIVLTWNFLFRKPVFEKVIYKRIIWTSAACGIISILYYF